MEVHELDPDGNSVRTKSLTWAMPIIEAAVEEVKDTGLENEPPCVVFR